MSDSETFNNARPNDAASKTSAGSDRDSSASGSRAGEKESKNSAKKGRKGSGSADRKIGGAKPVTESARKRTSSGRVVRQRVQLVEEYSDDDEEDGEKGKGHENTSNTGCSPPKPRPTSLNPFRIPVNLLNFKAQNRFT